MNIPALETQITQLQEQIALLKRREHNPMNIQELERQLNQMQEQVAKLKKEQEAPQPQFNHQAEEDFSNALNEMSNIFSKAVKDLKQDQNQDIILASTVVGVCPGKDGKFAGGQATVTCYSIEDFREENLATAMDVFSNPRRINIIKNLITAPLTASEITQKTGLVGGQLYHHLGILENANLIEKSAEKYSAPETTQLMLGGLMALTGGMRFVQTEEANNGLPA